MADPLFDGLPLPLAPMTRVDRQALQDCEASFLAAVVRADLSKAGSLLANGFSCVRENGQVLTKPEFLESLSSGWFDTSSWPLLDNARFGDVLVTVSRCVFADRPPSAEPPVVMHIWFQQGDVRPVLVHRHESQPGRARGELMPQWGGSNRSGDVGNVPMFQVAAAVSAREAALSHAMTVNDREKLRALLHPDLRYIHVTGHYSGPDEFPFERSTGFSRVEFIGTTMRQFGRAVIALVNADFVHQLLPAQSRARAMHCWVDFEGDWRLVARQSTRFLPY